MVSVTGILLKKSKFYIIWLLCTYFIGKNTESVINCNLFFFYKMICTCKYLHLLDDKIAYSSAKNIVCIVLLCGFLQKLLNVYITFTDPTEKVTIQVLPQSSTIKEGDNITLKCSGNGNPPPQEFLFYIPVSPASPSLRREIFCIVPSYSHCCMSEYT